MKIEKLNEDIRIGLDTEYSDDYPELNIQEVVISDRALRRYIDAQYTAEDIITLASQIDDDIKPGDLDDAYDILFQEVEIGVDANWKDDYDAPSNDINEFIEYMDRCIQDDYMDEAEKRAEGESEEQEQAEEEQKAFEREHMW